MGFLASAQAHVHSHLIAILQELRDLFGAECQIMRARRKSYPDALELRLFLLLAVLALAFFALVLELAEVHDAAYRGTRSRGDLNEIQSLLMRDAECLGGFKHAEILALLADHADRRDADPLIDAVSSLNGIK